MGSPLVDSILRMLALMNLYGTDIDSSIGGSLP